MSASELKVGDQASRKGGEEGRRGRGEKGRRSKEHVEVHIICKLHVLVLTTLSVRFVKCRGAVHVYVCEGVRVMFVCVRVM